jgi:hypothetical protein
MGCGGGGGSGLYCEPGTASCLCLNDLCEVGLVCTNNFCLDASAETSGDGDGDPGDGDGDPGDGDGDGDGEPTTGDGDGDPGPACTPMGGLGLGPSAQTMVYGSTIGESDVYSGSCGGDGGNEQVYMFVPPYPGTYFIGVSAEFDSILYLRDGNDCTGAELACNGDVGNSPGSYFEVSLEFNQYYTIFVDSHDEPGDYSIYIEYIM